MKTLRQLSIALVFVFALAIPAFAGEIQTPFAPPPPPPQAQAATTDGEISTPFVGQAETGSSETTVTDSTREIALNLLQSVLSLF